MTRDKTHMVRVKPETHRALDKRRKKDDTFDCVIRRILEDTDGVTAEDVAHEVKENAIN